MVVVGGGGGSCSSSSSSNSMYIHILSNALQNIHILVKAIVFYRLQNTLYRLITKFKCNISTSNNKTDQTIHKIASFDKKVCRKQCEAVITKQQSSNIYCISKKAAAKRW